MRPDLLFDNFNLVTEAPDGIPKMREMILQLAVQGKLVPQDPNDEPASELLKRIAAEKERLMKEGKIKKQKPLPPIKPEEIPANLPNGWEFKRLGDLTICRDGERVPLSKNERQKRKGPYDYYGASGIIDKIDNYLFDKPLLLIGEDGANLINRATPIAFIAEGKYWVNNHAHVIDGISYQFLKYLELYINAIDLKPYVSGTAQPKMNQYRMNLIFVLLPPQKEQKRIVEKVDELMALCDQMEAEKEKSLKHRITLNATAIDHLLEAKSASQFDKHWHLIANNFDLLYDNPENVQKLRQAILQLAVSGKLVPQNPSDEPASELLIRISAEKDRLIKEGKIKKQKPLPPVDPDEVPYELPDGWVWTRIRDVSHDLGQKKPIERFTYIDVNSINNTEGSINNNLKVLSHKEAPSRARKIVDIGSVIYSTVRPYLLNVAILDRDLAPEPIVSTAFFVMHPFSGMNCKFIFYYLRSLPFIQYVESAMAGVAYPAINDEKMSMGLIPLPPSNEQKRIVEKVDQLMTLCDQMEACLENSSAQADTLFKTIAEQVTASSTNSAYVN